MQYEIVEHIKKSVLDLKLGIQTLQLKVEYQTDPLTEAQIFSTLERCVEGIIIRRPNIREFDIYESNIHCRGTWHRLVTTTSTKLQWEKIKNLFSDKLEDRQLVNGYINLSLSKADDQFLPILRILSGYGEPQIPIEQEPEDFKNHFHGEIEDCFFCHIPTTWWHNKSNTPVCPDCANKRFISELPDRIMKGYESDTE